MAIQKKFKRFNEEISISREAQECSEIRKKDDSIKEEIKSAFKEAGYPVISEFIQGSLSTHTAVRSLSGDLDLDRALVIDEKDAPEDPVECKKVLRNVLANRGFSDPQIKIPCVTADYVSLDFHLDHTIYTKDVFGGFKLGIGKLHSLASEKTWQSGDPKGLISWVNGSNHPMRTEEQRAQYRRCIRYLKRWRDVVFSSEGMRKKIYSIALTVMCVEQYRESFDQDGTPSDLEAMLETVSAILDGGYFHCTNYQEEKYDVVVNLPTLPFRDIFSKHGHTVGTQLRNKFKRLKSKLESAKAEESLKKQCEILREVFGDDFPEGENEPKKSAAIVHNSGGRVPNHGGA